MKNIRGIICFILVFAMCCGLVTPLNIHVRADEPDIVYWNPEYGEDANDGSTAGQAVRTFDKALELAGSYADIMITRQYQITSNVTLDGGAGKDITIKTHELQGDAFSIFSESH